MGFMIKMRIQLTITLKTSHTNFMRQNNCWEIVNASRKNNQIFARNEKDRLVSSILDYGNLV